VLPEKRVEERRTFDTAASGAGVMGVVSLAVAGILVLAIFCGAALLTVCGDPAEDAYWR